MSPINQNQPLLARAPHFNEKLQKEILEMSKNDQEARKKVVESLNGDLNTKVPDDIANAVWDIDLSHNLPIKRIIGEHGWADFSLVGEEGSHEFWLLVQHQDKDVELQLECLKLLEEAVNRNEASGKDFAYLTDRIKMNQGLPQVYGTQLTTENGKLKLYPVENPEFLDQRRREYNLPTTEEYMRDCIEGYNLSEDVADEPVEKSIVSE